MDVKFDAPPSMNTYVVEIDYLLPCPSTGLKRFWDGPNFFV